ncbi:MAG: hypothetical protein QME60_09475, partial [Verrucomicrobiota bacterium]|nr:hypothetical protein [Verrucomicrobiota bacterium]
GAPPEPAGGSPARRLANFRVFFRRRRLRVHRATDSPPTPEEVNRLLDKITAQGIGSLTNAERRALDQASKSAGRQQAWRAPP